MTNRPKEPLSPARQPLQAQIREDLARAGFGPEAAEALVALDAHNFQLVRRVMKGDLPKSLLEELGAGLEVTHFHALSAILRIQQAKARPGPAEVTVGHLAEEMAIDPSRASRIAADLVERGLIARAVSQEDGRRSVLVPTPEAGALMEGFLRAKWARTIRLFSSWPEEDVVTFVRLYARYAEGFREQYPGGR